MKQQHHPSWGQAVAQAPHSRTNRRQDESIATAGEPSTRISGGDDANNRSEQYEETGLGREPALVNSHKHAGCTRNTENDAA
jgi:hypothetical protein